SRSQLLRSEPPSVLLRQFLDAQVAERDCSVVALQENRAGFGHLVVDLGAGGLVALDLVVNLLAVEDDGDLVADDRRLDGLPFAAGFRREFTRSGLIVDGAVAGLAGSACRGIAQNLDLGPAA